MTFKEYKTLIDEALTNADKAPANFKTIVENLQVDLTTMSTQVEKIMEQEARIRDLQDTNMKLFLEQTSTRPEEEIKEELTGQDAIDDFINNLKGEDEDGNK